MKANSEKKHEFFQEWGQLDNPEMILRILQWFGRIVWFSESPFGMLHEEKMNFIK